MYIQLTEKKAGLQMALWTTGFSYSESCKNVYLRRKVFKDDKKSTIPCYFKNVFSMSKKEDIPDIFTANTFFWNSGKSASNRRNNEKRRNAQLEAFTANNEAGALIFINNYAKDFLLPGEVIDILKDRLLVKADNYYFLITNTLINKQSIDAASSTKIAY